MNDMVGKYGRFLGYLVCLAAGMGTAWLIGRNMPWPLLAAVTAVAVAALAGLLLSELYNDKQKQE